MFHRVKTESKTQDQTSSASEVKTQEVSRMTEATSKAHAPSSPENPVPENQAFVKSQTSSGKTPSYLQPTKMEAGISLEKTETAQPKESNKPNFSATEQRVVKTTETKTETQQIQQKEKDTDIMSESSSIVSQTTPYQTSGKTEVQSPASSLYTAESNKTPSPSGYAPSYSSPYAKQTAAATVPDAYASGSDSKLTIGRGITMSGEIESCDHLHVEGTVEAALKGAQVLDIAESGIFYGTVEIENANISGRFEGELTVKGRLLVESTGVITGSITYGELQIESGAIIDGRLTPMATPTVDVAPVERSVSTPSSMTPKQATQESTQQQQSTTQGKGLFEKQSVVPAE